MFYTIYIRYSIKGQKQCDMSYMNGININPHKKHVYILYVLHISIKVTITNIQLLLTLEKVAPTLFMLFVLLESGISIRKLYS